MLWGIQSRTFGKLRKVIQDEARHGESIESRMARAVTIRDVCVMDPSKGEQLVKVHRASRVSATSGA